MGVLQEHNCAENCEFLTILLQEEEKNVTDREKQQEKLIGLIGKFLESLKLEQECVDSKENQNQRSEVNFKVNAFNKLAKLIGRQENVFGFISMLKCEDSRNRILELFGKDEKIGKKMDRYLERVGKGESDAKEFFGDLLEQEAFLSGGCLNLKVNGNGIKLETSKYFQRVANLNRVKIFGNGGKRIMTIVKDETDGRRNYLYTRHAEMELGILWSVPKSTVEDVAGNGFQNCKVLLKIKNGRVTLKEVDLSEEEGDLLTFAGKYPPGIFLRGRTLAEVLEKGFQLQQQQEGSKEKIRIRGIVSPSPLEIQFGEIKINQVLDDFRNLDVDVDTSDSKDEDGISNESVIDNVNPFDKMAKFYGRGEQNPFLFNYVVQHPGHLETIREVMTQKFGNDSEEKMKRFERRREIYVERVKNGAVDAGHLLRKRQLPENALGSTVIEAFTHGNYFQRSPGTGSLESSKDRNIHQNLNVHVFETGNGFGTVALNTSAVFFKKFPKMTREQSELQRVKIFGNGEKLAKIVKIADNDQNHEKENNWKRNYVFSKRGNENLLDLEIVWNTQGNCDGLPFGIVLKIKNGAISGVKKMTFENGVRVKTEKVLKLETAAVAEVLEHSKNNGEVLIGGKSLYEVLGEFFDKAQKMKMAKMNKKKMTPEVHDDDDDVQEDKEEFTILEDAEFAEVDVDVQ